MFRREPWPCPLHNSSEAALFSGLLTEEGIPHKIVRHGDSLWGFSETITDGWGHVETTKEFQPRLESLYSEFQSSANPLPEEVSGN
jgi:hypothetical protein